MDPLLHASDLPSDTIETVGVVLDTPKGILLGDSKCSRSEINEFVLKLEKENPTSDPASSPLMNGVWELVVSGVTSPGLIGYQIVKAIPGSFIEATDFTITISSVQPRVTAATTIKVGPAKLDVSVTTELIAETGVRVKEEYVSGKIGTVDIPLKSIPYLSREVVVTYLDEDLMIVRDVLGSPEILKRK